MRYTVVDMHAVLQYVATDEHYEPLSREGAADRTRIPNGLAAGYVGPKTCPIRDLLSASFPTILRRATKEPEQEMEDVRSVAEKDAANRGNRMTSLRVRWRKTRFGLGTTVHVYVDDELCHCARLATDCEMTLPQSEGPHQVRVMLLSKGVCSAKSGADVLLEPPGQCVTMNVDRTWGRMSLAVSQNEQDVLFSPADCDRLRCRKVLLKSVDDYVARGAAFVGLGGEVAYLKASDFSSKTWLLLSLLCVLPGLAYRLYHVLFPYTFRLICRPDGTVASERVPSVDPSSLRDIPFGTPLGQ